MTDKAPWWNLFFDDEYASFGLVVHDEKNFTQLLDFIVRTLELKPGNLIFDQCCGIGRLSIPLAERGMRIIGVDRVKSYIDRATSRAKESQLACTFHCGDAFEFVATEPCDAAINWFTSFGYSENDEVNIRMLQRVFDSLKPGARFLIDYLNFPRIFADYQHTIAAEITREDGSVISVIQANRTDYLRGMHPSTWTIIRPDGKRIKHEIETRVYLPHNIAHMLKQCGFEVIELSGSREGEPFDRISPRCIIHARKP